jgi:hypothetical protein
VLIAYTIWAVWTGRGKRAVIQDGQYSGRGCQLVWDSRWLAQWLSGLHLGIEFTGIDFFLGHAGGVIDFAAGG